MTPIVVKYVGNVHEFPDLWDEKNRKKKITHTKGNQTWHKKLSDSAICLCLRSCSSFTIFRKIIQNVALQFSLQLNTLNPNLKKRYLYLIQQIHNRLKMGQKFSGLGLPAQFSALWTKPKKISH